MPDETAKDQKEIKPERRDEKRTGERSSRRERTFLTEDTDNPLICRGID